MPLKYEKETIYSVDYYDLEKFVKEIYKIDDYEFVAIEECGNDSQHRFDIDGKLSDYDEEEADQIRKGKIDTYQNRILLNTLCADGHISPGIYIISVCW